MDRCFECNLYNVQKTDTWKDIKGYEGNYRINDKGEVQYRENNEKEWKTKKIKMNNNGYCYVRLSKSGKKEQKYVHRLVAKAFIENAEKKKTVNHKNGKKICNCVGNLEWMTQEENNQDYVKRLKSK